MQLAAPLKAVAVATWVIMETPAAGGAAAPQVSISVSVLADLLAEVKQLRKEAADRDTLAAARDAQLRKEAADRDTQLRADIAALFAPKESPSATSYANVGFEALAALAASNQISQANPPPAGATAEELAPIATPAELATLSECGSEAELVASITPLLAAARGVLGAGDAADPCARLLLNSEHTPWLDSLDAPVPSDQRKRPDLFGTWAPFWSGRLTDIGATGRLAARALQLDGCAREFYEAKVGVKELTPRDFGQLVDYHSRVRGSVRGMLFNARHFWLFQSERCLPVALTKGQLGAPGSRALLRRFFDAGAEPPLLPLLRHLFAQLHVTPRRTAVIPGSEDSSVFLGAGGSARVFGVATEQGEPCALKASTLLSAGELRYEFDTMQRAANAGAPVVPPVPDSLITLVQDSTGRHCGGGFLLRGVCRRTTLGSAARHAEAFAALHDLHAAGFAHGDARLPNLLRSEGGRLLWVDFREGADDSGGSGEGGMQAAQRADARTLAASLLGIGQGGALPEAVLAALAAVPSDPLAYARVARALLG